MSCPHSSPLFRSLREARTLWVLGARVRLLVGGEDTSGAYSMVEVYLPPVAADVPKHLHEDCEALLHMLEGGLKVLIDEQWSILRPGDTLIVPRGTPHTFSNPFLTPCRFLTQYTPAGFEQFFADAGVAATDMFRPDAARPTPDQMRALAGKHHMTLVGHESMTR